MHTRNEWDLNSLAPREKKVPVRISEASIHPMFRLFVAVEAKVTVLRSQFYSTTCWARQHKKYIVPSAPPSYSTLRALSSFKSYSKITNMVEVVECRIQLGFDSNPQDCCGYVVGYFQFVLYDMFPSENDLVDE
jgi:hypothetical protein